MWTKLGIYSLLAGFFIGVFTGISKFMKADNFWIDLTLSKITGEYSDNIVEFIPIEAVENVFSYVLYELPFAGLVVALSLVFFLIGAISREY